jgi:uncharacterized phage-associated protein
MANVFDVAKYILECQGRMTTMKLQKLVYYCQAWSLVWDEKPLFPECIRAWASGPVVRELYDLHKGTFKISHLRKGNVENLEPDEKETIVAVLRAYGGQSAQWLSDLTHMEKPWSDARRGVSPGQSCDEEITLASMHEYYSSL